MREHDCEIHLAAIRWVFGDVRYPQPIRPIDGELPVDQIVVGLAFGSRLVQPLPAAPIDALHTGVAHQPGDPLAADVDAGPEPQLGMHPWRP